MRLCNSQQEHQFGSVVWYLDKSTKNVLYAIDGEDNTEYYSYDAIRQGKLASPEHICHYDLWFTNAYPFVQVKGVTRLKEENELSFNMKNEEIFNKANKWRDTVLAGRVTPDGRKLLSFSGLEQKPLPELKEVFNFFACKAMISDDTDYYYNNQFQGKVFQLYPEVREASLKVLAAEDQAVIDLVNQYKNGDQSAADQLLEKYDKMLLGIWHSFLKQKGLHPESPKAQDAYSEVQFEFLNSMTKYDPTKEKLSTYIYKNVVGALKNFFNPQRHKNLNKEVSIPHHKVDDTEGIGNSFDIMPQTREPGVKDVEREDFWNNILNSLPPELQNIMHQYIYEHKTYEEIGNDLGITRQGVEQIVSKALESIRLNPKIRDLGLDKTWNDKGKVLNEKQTALELVEAGDLVEAVKTMGYVLGNNAMYDSLYMSALQSAKEGDKASVLNFISSFNSNTKKFKIESMKIAMIFSK